MMGSYTEKGNLHGIYRERTRSSLFSMRRSQLLSLPRWLARGFTSQSSSPTLSTLPTLRIFQSTTHDAIFNLATEEWIFRDLDPQGTETLFLWRNDRTVVIGRNQNPWVECRVQNMQRDGVALARRRSGGGAVYQDLGNTCFTFLSSSSTYNKEKNTNILCGALGRLGIRAEASGRNDIVVDGFKVSGSAFKISRDRAFHHGTLLIDVNMDALENYLSPNKAKLESKGVQSVRSRVQNLRTWVPDLDHSLVCTHLAEEFARFYGHEAFEIVTLDHQSLQENASLKKYYEELSDWNWRFGETPKFMHQLSTRFDWGILDIHVNSEKGRITNCRVFSDSLYPDFIDSIASTLPGHTYDELGIRQACLELGELYGGDQALVSYVQDLERWLTDAI